MFPTPNKTALEIHGASDIINMFDHNFKKRSKPDD